MELVCIQDYEDKAGQLLAKRAFNYYKLGAGQMTTLQLNRDYYKRLRLRPKCLQNVSKIDLSTSILGFDASMPIGISPTAGHMLAHPDGEIASAKAAEKAGVIFTLSTGSNCSIEEVAEAAPKLTKWFQLYMHSDRRISQSLVKRAEKSGFSAIVLTVDSPTPGGTYEGKRLGGPQLQPNIKFANFMGLDPWNRKDTVFDRTFTWDGVKFLVGTTKLPVLAKGILRADDAKKAIEAGCKGIVVSNHGGRNLDTVPATIEALPEILEAVKGRVPVIIDGGLTLGTDVLKALAIGADMVFIGRPILWGLAVKGQEGVEEVLSLLRKELENAMMFCGSATLKQVTKDLVFHESYYYNALTGSPA